MTLANLAMVLIAASVAQAGNLKNKKGLDNLNTGITAAKENIKKFCGSTPEIEVKDASTVVTSGQKANESIVGRIESVSSAFQALCEGDDKKDEKAAAATIKKVTLVFAEKTKKIEPSLKNGSLSINFSWASPNFYYDLLDWLKENL